MVWENPASLSPSANAQTARNEADQKLAGSISKWGVHVDLAIRRNLDKMGAGKNYESIFDKYAHLNAAANKASELSL